MPGEYYNKLKNFQVEPIKYGAQDTSPTGGYTGGYSPNTMLTDQIKESIVNMKVNRDRIRQSADQSLLVSPDKQAGILGAAESIGMRNAQGEKERQGGGGGGLIGDGIFKEKIGLESDIQDNSIQSSVMGTLEAIAGRDSEYLQKKKKYEELRQQTLNAMQDTSGLDMLVSDKDVDGLKSTLSEKEKAVEKLKKQTEQAYSDYQRSINSIPQWFNNSSNATKREITDLLKIYSVSEDDGGIYRFNTLAPTALKANSIDELTTEKERNDYNLYQQLKGVVKKQILSEASEKGVKTLDKSRLTDEALGNAVQELLGSNMSNWYYNDYKSAQADYLTEWIETGKMSTYFQRPSNWEDNAWNNFQIGLANVGTSLINEFGQKLPKEARQFYHGRSSAFQNTFGGITNIIPTGGRLLGDILQNKEIADFSKRVVDSIQNQGDIMSHVNNKSGGSWGYIGAGLGAIMDSAALLIGAMPLTGSPAATAATGGNLFGVASGADFYNQLRDKNYSVIDSLLISIPAGYSIAYLERIGFESWLANSGATSTLSKVFAAVFGEGLTEGIQSFDENIVTNLFIDKRRGWFDGVVESAIWGAIGGGLMSPFSVFKPQIENEIIVEIRDKIRDALGEEGSGAGQDLDDQTKEEASIVAERIVDNLNNTLTNYRTYIQKAIGSQLDALRQQYTPAQSPDTPAQPEYNNEYFDEVKNMQESVNDAASVMLENETADQYVNRVVDSVDLKKMWEYGKGDTKGAFENITKAVDTQSQRTADFYLTSGETLAGFTPSTTKTKADVEITPGKTYKASEFLESSLFEKEPSLADVEIKVVENQDVPATFNSETQQITVKPYDPKILSVYLEHELQQYQDVVNLGMEETTGGFEALTTPQERRAYTSMFANALLAGESYDTLLRSAQRLDANATRTLPANHKTVEGYLNQAYSYVNSTKGKGVMQIDKQELAQALSLLNPSLISTIPVNFSMKGGKQGQADFANGTITLFKDALTSGNFTRTTIHEYWHLLGRYLSDSDVKAIEKEYESQKAKYTKENPDWEKRINAQNYRYTSLEEFFAEIMTDETMIRLNELKSKPRTILGYAKRVFDRVMSIISPNTQQRIFDKLKAEKNLSIQRMNRIDTKQTADMPSFKDGEVTTTILEEIKGRGKVSKQFISDLTNRGNIKQAERDIIREALDSMPEGKIDVEQFTESVQAMLLPLEEINLTKSGYGARYENVTLNDEIRGDILTYNEKIYNSPIKTQAGRVHFHTEPSENYFGHTRIEDMADGVTRRIIEVQSDLFQKGRLEREVEEAPGVTIPATREQLLSKIANYEERLKDVKISKTSKEFYEEGIEKARKELEDVYAPREKEIAPLKPYRNTFYERLIREEVNRAAQDGKEILLFPTGETALKIEGLTGEAHGWKLHNGMELDLEDLGDTALMQEAKERGLLLGDGYSAATWYPIDILGDGKFTAVQDFIVENDQELYNAAIEKGYIDPEIDEVDAALYQDEEMIQMFRDKGHIESFDISPKIDKNNPIYKFYEKDVQKFLKRTRPDLKTITDENGVTWYQTSITEKDGGDVLAFMPSFDQEMSPEEQAAYQEEVMREVEQETAREMGGEFIQDEVNRMVDIIKRVRKQTSQDKVGEFEAMAGDIEQLKSYLRSNGLNNEANQLANLEERVDEMISEGYPLELEDVWSQIVDQASDQYQGQTKPKRESVLGLNPKNFNTYEEFETAFKNKVREMALKQEAMPKVRETISQLKELETYKKGDISRVREEIKQYARGAREATRQVAKEQFQARQSMVSSIQNLIDAKDTSAIGKGQLNKLLRAVRDAKTQEDVMRAMKEVEGISEEIKKNVLKDTIKKELDKYKVKKDEKGKTNLEYEYLRQGLRDIYYDGSRIKTQQENEQMLKQLQSSLEDYTMETEITQQDMVNYSLLNESTKGLNEMSVGELDQVITRIKDTRSLARDSFIMQQIDRAADLTNKIQQCVDNMWAKHAVEGTLENKKQMQDFLKDFVKSVDVRDRGFAQIINLLDSIQGGRFYRDVIYQPMMESNKVFMEMDNMFKEEDKAFLEKLFNLRGRSLDKKLQNLGKQVYIGEFKAESGKLRKLWLTPGQMMNYYVSYQMKDNTNAMENDGIYIGGAMLPSSRLIKITPEIMQEIESKMDDKVKSMAEYIIKGVNDNRITSPMKKAYEDKYNKPFVGVKGGYWTMKRRYMGGQQQGYDVFNPDKRGVGLPSPSSLKQRVDNNNPLIMEDAWATFQKWRDEITRFIAYDKALVNAKSIIGSKEFKSEFIERFGAGSYRQLSDSFDFTAKNGEIYNDPLAKLMNLVRTGMSISYIGGKTRNIVTQGSSSVAAMADMPLGQFMKYFKNTISNPKKAYDKMMESPLVKLRHKRAGFSRGMFEAEATRMQKFRKSPAELAMAFTKLGDMAGVIGAGYTVYNFNYDQYIEQGMTKEKANKAAMQDAEYFVISTQQSSLPEFSNSIMRSHPVIKAFGGFQQSPSMYRAKGYEAMNTWLNKGDAKWKPENFKKMAREVLTYHLVLPATYEISKGNINPISIFTRSVFSPISGFMVYGKAIEWGLMLGLYQVFAPMIASIFGIDEEEIEELIPFEPSSFFGEALRVYEITVKSIGDIVRNENDDADLWNLVEFLGITAGVPVKNIGEEYSKFEDIITDKNRDALRLLETEWQNNQRIEGQFDQMVKDNKYGEAMEYYKEKKKKGYFDGYPEFETEQEEKAYLKKLEGKIETKMQNIIKKEHEIDLVTFDVPTGLSPEEKQDKIRRIERSKEAIKNMPEEDYQALLKYVSKTTARGLRKVRKEGDS